MNKPAILGGAPVLSQPLQPYRSMGREEAEAVGRVIESGCLSGFYGSWGDQFFGGPVVRDFEKAWCDRFGIRHAVSVNSATSGLIAAMGAIGISPGDEVITTPYSMSATAMAPLIYGGIPVFADIDPNTFCLDPQSVRRAITPRTKAILVVNLFGYPAPLEELASIAREHNIKLIEDNAQAPLAMEAGQLTGTVGDIGVFSLNYHKHIHTGEGGMCVTDDDELAQRLQLIRNHGENAVLPLEIEDITNLIGFNFRMTEMSAAVGIEQLKKIDYHVDQRELFADRLTKGVAGLEGLTPPEVRPGTRHVYFMWALRFDESVVGMNREAFCTALEAEGFPVISGYVEPIYLLPVFQKRTAIGSQGHPFNLAPVNYDRGLCPVTERLYEKELIGFEICIYQLDSEVVDLLIKAIHKVYDNAAKISAELSQNQNSG